MNFLGFISAAVLLTLMPGPDILFVVTQAVSRGKKAAVVFAAGLCSGLVVHTIAVCAGVSVLLMSLPLAFMLLKFIGAAYLFYLGMRAFGARYESHWDLDISGTVSGKLYRKGILMNVLNPKVILFFLAFFPQFIDPNVDNPMPQMVLLGVVFIVQAFLIFSMVAVLADRLMHGMMKNPQAAFWVNVAEAVIYCLIGISILLV